jgi:hypothetical protein
MNSDSGRAIGSGFAKQVGFHGGDGVHPGAGWAGCAGQLGHRSARGRRSVGPLRRPRATGGKEGQARPAGIRPILPRKSFIIF